MVRELGKLNKPITLQASEKGNLNLNQKEIQVYRNSDECIQSKKQLSQVHTGIMHQSRTLKNNQKTNN